MSARSPVAHPGRRLAGERGSMLLTAMLFAAGIALVLGSYLALSRTSLKLAHRTFFANDAANLAEAGIEEALYCFNQIAAGTAPAAAFSGWTFSGANAMRTLTPFNRDQQAVGVTKIFVKGYDGTDAAPVVISQATVTPFDGGAPITKTVHLAITLTTGVASPGLVGLEGVSFTGNTAADSYNSNPTRSATGPWLVYSSAIARANTSVGALGGALSIGGGTISGNLFLGPGVTAPNANKVTGTIRTDYSAVYPFPTYPTAAGVSQSYNLGSSIPAILPRAGDQAAADGYYYYFCNNTSIRSLTISALRKVTIVGTANVGMPVTAATPVILPITSTLRVYMTGPLTIAGTSLNALGYAGALEIYTTTTSTCTFGNGTHVVASFHAPSAALDTSGNTNGNRLNGRFIARTITLGGTYDYHYDESLPGMGAASTSYYITRWLDFQSAADRATVSGLTGGYLR
jgi:hypothetical protein